MPQKWPPTLWRLSFRKAENTNYRISVALLPPEALLTGMLTRGFDSAVDETKGGQGSHVPDGVGQLSCAAHTKGEAKNWF